MVISIEVVKKASNLVINVEAQGSGKLKDYSLTTESLTLNENEMNAYEKDMFAFFPPAAYEILESTRDILATGGKVEVEV